MEAWKAMKNQYPEYYGYCEDLLNEEYPGTYFIFSFYTNVLIDTEGQFVIPAPHIPKQEMEAESTIGSSGGQLATDSLGEFFYFPERLSMSILFFSLLSLLSSLLSPLLCA
jgi:hypothetical protein